MSCTISNIHQTLTYTRLASGPLVKIFVGPKEKLYSVPKDLIAHYSSYFASCFKNNWKEANEGVLRLPDDRPEFFDVLMEYFRHGEAKYAPKGNLDNMEWMEVLKTCFDFIRFTDMYDVIEASAAVKDILSSIFSRHRFDECVLAVGRDGVFLHRAASCRKSNIQANRKCLRTGAASKRFGPYHWRYLGGGDQRANAQEQRHVCCHVEAGNNVNLIGKALRLERDADLCLTDTAVTRQWC